MRMAITDEYDFELLVNEAERLVLKHLESQLAEVSESVCRCGECVLDMAAYALNNAKPMYRVSLLGSLYAHSLQGTAYEREISDAVATAIERVSSNPSH